jgi:hypothetical protein
MLENYYIEQITYDLAMEMIVTNHYLHRKAPYSMAFGLFHKNSLECLGVIVYGVPASITLLKGVCGEDEFKNVYELNRLWIDDSVPKNGESFLIGNTLKRLDKEIIVSYADSSYNHIGTVYQATNWLYTGLSKQFKEPKVRGLEHVHHTTLDKGLTKAEVVEKYGVENIYYVERARKHRYVTFNASRTRKKQLLAKLKYKVLPYPKRGEA